MKYIYTFTKDSALANIWANEVRSGRKKIEEVPALFNLIEVVKGILGLE